MNANKDVQGLLKWPSQRSHDHHHRRDRSDRINNIREPNSFNVAAQQPVLHTDHPPHFFALTQSCHLQYLALTLSILNVVVVWRNLLLLISLLHLLIPKRLIQCTASGSRVSSQSSTKRVCRYVLPSVRKSRF